MDSVRGFGAQAWPWQETVYHEECISTAFCTAIALQSIYLFQSHCLIFCPSTLSCMYITPGLYRIDMGVFLVRSNGPEYASCRPWFGLPMAVR